MIETGIHTGPTAAGSVGYHVDIAAGERFRDHIRGGGGARKAYVFNKANSRGMWGNEGMPSADGRSSLSIR